MLRKILLIFILVGIFTCGIYAQQTLSSSKKKAVKAYTAGTQYYQGRDFNNAILSFKQALVIDPEFIEAYLVLAEVYMDNRKPEQAIEYLKKGLEINPDFYPRAFVNLGLLQFNTGNYSEARESFNHFLTTTSVTSQQKKQVDEEIKKCDFALSLKNNPVAFNPVTIGPAINSTYDEYWPSLSADEQTLVITRLSDSETSPGKKQEDFFISRHTKSGWDTLKSAGFPLNTPDNEGAQSISADGRIMVFTACNRDDGVGRCDLYYSVREGSRWSLPRNMGFPVNTKFKETQPSLSADGRTLYFSSDRPGGNGQLDLWVSKQNENGIWSTPENLGDKINSSGNEMSPFIHQDNQTLYFSSDELPGMGGYDIFLSRKDSTGSWGKPENIGYPINTYKDEFGLIVNSAGTLAYYSSDIIKEQGKDIFSFELPREVRPIEVSYMKGKVFDVTNKEVLSARFELVDLETGALINQSFSDKQTGEFLVCIPVNKDYMLNVSREGYLFYSDHFALKNTYDKTEPFLKDIPLHPIRAGESMVLKNIFYETGLYQLLPESKLELDKLAAFLNTNSEVKIEIGGHTDNVGSQEYNLTLSENRAKTVMEYLVNSGISAQRLTYKGYGYSKSLAANNTEEGRAQNRRTEMKIMGN
ncbi:MAG: PD40 domain-containing protein [Bacteroidales bacterium]|nr:PD40 domain-containing protein [Bacteroidales bacterium]